MPGPTRLLGCALAVATLTACAPGVADPAPPAASQATTTTTKKPAPSRPAQPVKPVTTDRGRQSPGVIAAGFEAPYNYAPSVMLEGGRYRMWWCSQVRHAEPGGDDVLYADSASPDGGFAGPDGSSALAVLSGSTHGWDGVHTCDPSVLKVGGTYYMYYTGAPGDVPFGSLVGVATSPDGINWTRAAGGNPILGPANDTIRDNHYGSGQPSAVYVDGWFYLLFTDTTAKAAGWNGAGQFVLRAKDPTFGSQVEALGAAGWEKVADTRKPRTRSVVDAFSADWMYVDALRAFLIAHSTDAGTTLTFWNHDFATQPFPPLHIPGPWKEGPGLVRTPEGHAPISAEDPCGRMSVDVMRATVTGAAGAPTDIGHFGLDLVNIPGCRTKAQASVLNGFAVPSPENTIDLVVDGKVVRVERRSVTDRLATRVLAQRPDIVDELPVVARIPAGVKAVRAPNGQTGLLVDGKLWRVGPEEVAKLNSSPVTPVTQQQWDAFDHAGALNR
ncbi:beta-xylosidase [Saccharothrix sp.]|uniref:beta-xylosidase n=1 Tax=Saccharothrix sp. TaxID=1873460 RepID=UPI0028120AA8|nr:beta-xylosidase [Saccharothrix sp.]